MKNILIILFLFFNNFCLGQKVIYKDDNKIEYCLDKEGKEIFSYVRVFPEIDLYKSSHKEYPYLYLYKDKEEDLYIFIKEKFITFEFNRILINIKHSYNKKFSVYNRKNNKEVFLKFNIDD